MNCNSHQVRNNHDMSKEDDRDNEKVNETDEKKADKTGLNGAEDGLRVRDADVEQVIHVTSVLTCSKFCYQLTENRKLRCSFRVQVSECFCFNTVQFYSNLLASCNRLHENLTELNST